MSMVIRATISKGRAAGLFNIDVAGERIVENRTDAEFDACRVLLARGLTGTLITRWAGAEHDSFIIDIKRGAELAVSDCRFVRFRERPAQRRISRVIAAPSAGKSGSKVLEPQQ
jgi:hypothetical protein